MSIVRYVNKKTGRVAVYESTSHYDPITKQSRPKRKYLGTEDPETGELIPSSGQRGRKKTNGEEPKQDKEKLKLREKIDQLRQECANKNETIRQLEYEKKKLRSCLQKIRETAADMLGDTEITDKG